MPEYPRYISRTGADLPGYGLTSNKPCRTVKHLQSQGLLHRGATVHVMSDYDLSLTDEFVAAVFDANAPRLDGGKGYDWRVFAVIGQSGTPTLPIRFRPYGSAKRRIYGGGLDSVGFHLNGTASYIDIQGFEFVNMRTGIEINPYFTTTPNYKTCHHILIRDCVFRNSKNDPLQAFDIRPGTACGGQYVAIYINQRAHHVTIDKCTFVDLGPQQVLTPDQWYLVSAFRRDAAGRIYHAITNPNTGSADVIRTKTWGPFQYPGGGELVATVDKTGKVTTNLPESVLVADLGLGNSGALASALAYSPTHWFQHAHFIYAQGWEITIRDSMFSHNPMSWQIKVDGNVGVGVKRLNAPASEPALTEEDGMWFYDPLPDASEKLALYGLWTPWQHGFWYGPEDFPGDSDTTVRTHRIVGNVFDGKNMWLGTGSQTPQLTQYALQPSWTAKSLVHDILASNAVQPHFYYGINVRWSNIIFHTNGLTNIHADKYSGLICLGTNLPAECVPVFAWSPKNVLIEDNDFNPPYPWTWVPTDNVSCGSSAIWIKEVWGGWVGSVPNPVNNCKPTPVPLSTDTGNLKFVLATVGTEIVGNRLYPPPFMWWMSSFMRFEPTFYIACDPETEEPGFLFTGEGFVGCKPGGNPGLVGSLSNQGMAGCYPGAPGVAGTPVVFGYDGGWIGQGLFPFAPTPFDLGSGQNVIYGADAMGWPGPWLSKSKKYKHVAVFSGPNVSNTAYKGTGYLIPDLGAQLAAFQDNEWLNYPDM